MLLSLPLPLLKVLQKLFVILLGGQLWKRKWVPLKKIPLGTTSSITSNRVQMGCSHSNIIWMVALPATRHGLSQRGIRESFETYDHVAKVTLMQVIISIVGNSDGLYIILMWKKCSFTVVFKKSTRLNVQNSHDRRRTEFEDLKKEKWKKQALYGHKQSPCALFGKFSSALLQLDLVSVVWIRWYL